MPSHENVPSDAARIQDQDDPWSGVRRGPLRAGEWVRLTDTKGRRHNICLEAGKKFFTNRGSLDHDALIGRPEGISVTSSAGGEYLVFRPLLSEFVVSMPRGAAVVYPKDAAQIVAMADIFPGAHVVERNELEWRLDPQGSHRLPEATSHALRIIVICNEGYASSLAAQSLHQLGLRRATDLVGGFQAWRSIQP